jgi:hypothetical protein
MDSGKCQYRDSGLQACDVIDDGNELSRQNSLDSIRYPEQLPGVRVKENFEMHGRSNYKVDRTA